MTDTSTQPEAVHTPMSERTDDPAAVGLKPGTRYKCEGCGNLTRFDVTVTEHATRFWHAELSGEGRIESADDARINIESVSCRWCGSADRIVVERAPIGDPA
ncbi:hypothetical protein [Euzebya pacifica]|uniref:hypothetical protein n=1 Tax=Euzebya pacifica TaxID=1608957 RepID=UPI0030F901FF